MININNETLRYEDKIVLNNISLSIQKGEKIALLGKSGSGKSTLLKRFYETNPENCSYIPQDLGLVNAMSVFHNVYIANLDKNSTLYNILNLIKPHQKDIDTIKPILASLDMDDLMFNKCGALSGGQKQRAAIARSILQNRDILLADEPISALDENVSEKVLESIQKNFKTIICALHNVDVALEHFERVIGIKDGQIILDKKCSQISKKDTKNLYQVCDE